jgi:protein-disulfide isomerase
MINKSTIQKLFSVKATVTVILIALVAGGIYSAIHKKGQTAGSETATSENEPVVLKATGLDLKQPITNVGDVEKVIAKWVETNPEAIIQSVVAMQKQAAEKQQQDAQKNVVTKKSDLFNNKTNPTHSPKGYNVSLVEFFDYNCGYCKKAQSSVEELLKQDKKVRIIFKELPILGASSTELSKVAIAVNIMDSSKYLDFHDALMKGNARTKEEAIKVASGLGIDEARLQKTLTDKKSDIENQIKANQDLAAAIGIGGTPAFVIGEELIPGAVDLATLKDKIAAQRK